MVVQAGAARALVAVDPIRAHDALVAVDQAGLEALRELESLMSSMSIGEAERPNLGSSDIRSLVDEARRTGMEIELTGDFDPNTLDPGLQITVYRIVQEAITNAHKHAPGARAAVWIHLSPGAVEVEITDFGGVAERTEEPIPGAGQGLIGISERAALFGGDAEAGPLLGGGFRVWARLPREPAMA
jgi:signal transduction histidine kinase